MERGTYDETKGNRGGDVALRNDDKWNSLRRQKGSRVLFSGKSATIHPSSV